MLRNHVIKCLLLGVVVLGTVAGCGKERAKVVFGYALEPQKGLPPGMEVITIEPSQTGEATDAKWSDFVTTTIQQMVSDSRSRFGTKIKISDRRDTDATFDEADLAASGMSTGQGGASGGQILAAQGTIRSNIQVLIDRQTGTETTGTMSAGSLLYGGMPGVGTKEVETVRRTMTVQADFRLIDTGNNQIWEQLPPTRLTRNEETDAGAMFGKSKTEKDLESTDIIIGNLVEEAVRRFLSRIIKIRVEVYEEIESSGNEHCANGIKMLRAEAWDDAISSFKLAMAANSEDHAAAFGAGIASEASGRFDDAKKYYNLACAGGGDENPRYARARNRMKEYGHRAVK
ncbi:MAG: tetratricopeptide repeat protein [Planctomycetota bacterium]|jgi:hypothetical protein